MENHRNALVWGPIISVALMGAAIVAQGGNESESHEAMAAVSPKPQDCWPLFQGADGSSRTDCNALPLRWSESEHVRWKTPIHDRGHSSPVVWGNQIWVTTALADGKKLFAICVDSQTGKIVHDLCVFEVDKPEFCHPFNSYASPTPAIEEGRIYVHFGTYGTACLDTTTGKNLWSRRDLHCNHFRGPGSSAYLYKNLVILHFDGYDEQFVVALDKETGKTVWRTDRSTDFGNIDGDRRKAYCTPLVAETPDGPQVISCGAGAAMAYDPQSGKEIWKVRYPGGYSNAARPLYAAGLVFLNSGFDRPAILAVRPNGHGDVTDTHVVWRTKNKDVPERPSATFAEKCLWMVNDNGIASCVDANTGEQVWRKRIGGNFSATPLAAPGRIYFFDQDGKSTVIATERAYRSLAENRLDEGFMASPAVAGKALILRTKSHLYRIEE